MARPKKPAALKTGHNQSQTELEEMKEQENFIGGNDDEIKEVPKDLDKHGQYYYRFIVENLEVSGVLTNLDSPMVKQVSSVLSHIDYLDKVLSHGMFVDRIDKNGQKTQLEHPAFSMKMKLLSQFKSLATQLGLSPSSRSQLASLNVDQKMAENDPVMQVLSE